MQRVLLIGLRFQRKLLIFDQSMYEEEIRNERDNADNLQAAK